MSEILTLKRKRVTCARCAQRRYIDEMKLIFKHPLLNPKGIYLCRTTHYKLGNCLNLMLPEIMSYKETGLIRISTLYM